MNGLGRRARGFALVEIVVAAVLGMAAVWMILDILVETGRACDGVVAHEQMQQEAMLIAQAVERAVQCSVAPQDATGASAPGGGGETTAPLIPPSVAAAMRPTSGTASATTSPQAAAPAGAAAAADAMASAPVSVRQLITTSGARLLTPPSPAGDGTGVGAAAELFDCGTLRVLCMEPGRTVGPVPRTIRTMDSPGGESHVVMEARPPDGGPAWRRLGAHADKFCSQLLFRYADGFAGFDARWTDRASARPRVLEYTVRVWARGAGPGGYDGARDRSGRPVRFELVSGTAIP